ncbi:hypothetical protein E1U88_03905 [Listeria monocytogenes]|nr:hypothetical protein [Listeria monocytogenes]EAD5394605.1 hypothetical protein [Listeria monocytogenes]EAD6021008.1 hypothetical protein [Listeria monocytogenes]EAD6093805.1 hypothetical protein [Listeria monocytogenes]EAE2805309.1 hypothetical protein [Listeria monocytogenes]
MKEKQPHSSCSYIFSIMYIFPYVVYFIPHFQFIIHIFYFTTICLELLAFSEKNFEASKIYSITKQISRNPLSFMLY